ncbi:multimeric flavodoxin WrbA [Acetoanaerobium pronyense]|uniref:Multimeric flavodoxin WrbA n=1 Tax=Acetoanaerobium pronyense TaxID=1482736 RepID=A0ABS4KG43_9FIRM|nr:NAD(P)H-dependent oxidoreductase [Acetoanaerobium pronyense]MBP2026735.1 multimeric flavodoxin WrbA [Acetoanaerobium pronyense]
MLHVISKTNHGDNLKKMIEASSKVFEEASYLNLDEFYTLKTGDIVLFALQPDKNGIDYEVLSFFERARNTSKDFFKGTFGAIICYSENEFYTKHFSSQIAFLANLMGCEFIGKPLVEAISNFENFRTWQKVYSLTLEEICLRECEKNGNRLKNYKSKLENPFKKITSVHASSPHKSNTYALMDMVIKDLNIETEVFSLAEKKIMDCRGCYFDECMAFAVKDRCFYENDSLNYIFDSINNSDALLIACPNYNDSMPANYFAMVNRMTYVYRTKDLSDKYIYSIIVSSNSGSDMVAMQIISAFCFNKGFRLPPYFSLFEMASDPLSILQKKGIEKKAESFAMNIFKSICT